MNPMQSRLRRFNDRRPHARRHRHGAGTVRRCVGATGTAAAAARHEGRRTRTFMAHSVGESYASSPAWRQRARRRAPVREGHGHRLRQTALPCSGTLKPGLQRSRGTRKTLEAPARAKKMKTTRWRCRRSSARPRMPRRPSRCCSRSRTAASTPPRSADRMLGRAKEASCVRRRRLATDRRDRRRPSPQAPRAEFDRGHAADAARLRAVLAVALVLVVPLTLLNAALASRGRSMPRAPWPSHCQRRPDAAAST